MYRPDFALSLQFYADLNFHTKWSDQNAAELRLGSIGFLLQAFFVQQHAGNFMMHLMVENADVWWRHIETVGFRNKYPGIMLKPPELQPWGLRVLYLSDPSGVLWHIADRRSSAPSRNAFEKCSMIRPPLLKVTMRGHPSSPRQFRYIGDPRVIVDETMVTKRIVMARGRGTTMLRAAIGAILMLCGIACYAAETCDYGSTKNGLIVFSGTMPINTTIPPIIGTPSAFIYTYNHAGGGYLTQQQAWLTPEGLFHPLPSDFPDVGYGRLFILRLKAGDYEFQDWSYRGYGREGDARATDIKPLKFTVEAGHAVYLGNFDPKMFTGTTSGGRAVLEPWLTVRDQSFRDLAVFQTKCPKFDVPHVEVKILDAAPWAAHPGKL